ncbi:hypothetical protein HUZ36_14135 [Pseudoalteromonas sp. McH1-7]|uniref:Uncharacterized protein n=1 Tax=Pseudoalteromonas peptidolytica F12-50-A1 TaxID=1315280 RepID=A0A8I0MXN6_9GAMM|nr:MULTISPECIES: hypothetical protein [Pseudoalteromonas]MBE0347874.1 hypothetical protein [Pseudoalteromonas peptidolytica F12-50-A1]MDW7551308.1 hypothetical protein [Pseudoalteromonas peptidolytica]NLR15326.1 hypothetical protein [Pseudoalteromonas peptidolytica]NUZ11923.1 hypothetical protein [Pseudoalteromonas sp. McH1-7]RRS09113.1 hypothetical protein EAG18_08310 [Pseudoalteromonas sp. J010]
MDAKHFNATFVREDINIAALLNTTYQGGPALIAAYEALSDEDKAKVLCNAAINVGVGIAGMVPPVEYEKE